MNSKSSTFRRRWLQFSLRTFFVVPTTFAVWLGWATNEARRQRSVVDWIEGKRGTVRYDYEFDANGLPFGEPSLELPGPTWLRELLGIDFLANVVWVDLRYREVNDLTRLAALEHLESLDLSKTPAESMEPLAGLGSIRYLNVSDTQVSDLTPLSGMRRLRSLIADNTPVRDLTVLSGLRHLKDISLNETRVTDLTSLGNIEGLEQLQISGTDVSDLAPLSKLRNLKFLAASNAPVTNLAPLSKLHTLKYLWVGGANSPVGPDEVALLQVALPNCDVVFMGCQTTELVDDPFGPPNQ